jgi:hypothetical protein
MASRYSPTRAPHRPWQLMCNFMRTIDVLTTASVASSVRVRRLVVGFRQLKISNPIHCAEFEQTFGITKGDCNRPHQSHDYGGSTPSSRL